MMGRASSDAEDSAAARRAGLAAAITLTWAAREDRRPRQLDAGRLTVNTTKDDWTHVGSAEPAAPPHCGLHPRRPAVADASEHFIEAYGQRFDFKR